jgi:branched-chain amino acid transport system ATP-binding protein
MTAPFLSTSGLSVSYGRAEAVHQVSISIARGSIVAVIGSNGAGKTTLLNAIMGLLHSSGTIHFDGNDIRDLSVEQRVVAGMTLVPERRELFTTLSVDDNLRLGAFRARRGELTQRLERVYANFPRLKERWRQHAGTLSGGERQMLAMGRALMANPTLLMLDEPSLGLAPRIVRETFQIISDLSATGVSILLIEQNARAALELASFGYVMEVGRIPISGPARTLAEDDRVVESYLGINMQKDRQAE